MTCSLGVPQILEMESGEQLAKALSALATALAQKISHWTQGRRMDENSSYRKTQREQK